MTILVTGGTGKTGRRVADRLTALDTPLRVATRHSEPRFDWYDDATWDRALAGCTAAWVTFQPDVCLPGADAILGAFARRAVALGCTRLVLLSGRGEDGARRAEAALTRSGAEWTILRSAFFFQNFAEAFWADEIATGSLTMVESTVGEPFVDADDIADVAVACLLDPVHSGRVHELAGPRLLTFEDVASLVARRAARGGGDRPCPALRGGPRRAQRAPRPRRRGRPRPQAPRLRDLRPRCADAGGRPWLTSC
jgi:uncharacterized protein YbjT (DUF2867 family)